MTARFPNESEAYRRARNALLDEEIALRAQIEAVAKARRSLPPGGEVESYSFTDLDGNATPMASLFGDHDTLALYSFMFKPGDARPCPACTSLVDGWVGQAAQVQQRIAFAAVSSATPDALKALVDARGWHDIPFFSAQGTDYQRRYFGEDENGTQRTFMNVFSREDGVIRHFWGSEIERANLEGHPRHIDSLWPIWGLLDLTPKGRGDFFPKVFE